MNKALRTEKWLNAFWIVIGLTTCFGSYRLSLGSFNDPGPGMFAFIAGALLSLLAFIQWFGVMATERSNKEASGQGIHTQASEPLVKHAGTSQSLWANRLGVIQAASIVVMLMLYALSMEHLGFIISTSFFIAFLLWLVERQRWYVIVFGSVFAALAAYLVFKVWLDTALPLGLFGF